MKELFTGLPCLKQLGSFEDKQKKTTESFVTNLRSDFD